MNMSFLWWLVDPLLGFFLSKTKEPPTPLPKAFEAPETEVGTPIPVIFGTRDVPIFLAWYGKVGTQKRKVNSSSKK